MFNRNEKPMLPEGTALGSRHEGISSASLPRAACGLTNNRIPSSSRPYMAEGQCKRDQSVKTGPFDAQLNAAGVM